MDLLLPYGRRWVGDEARFKIGMWARQTGKSWHSALEAVRDCLAHKTTWVCLSAGERQALEFMRKVKEWAEAMKFAIADSVIVSMLADTIGRAMYSCRVRRDRRCRWERGTRQGQVVRPDPIPGAEHHGALDHVR